MVAASKAPMLKPDEFELWRMRIKQYIQMIDYALWEVIENGATLPKTTVVEGVEKVMSITSAEDKAQRRLDVKARSTLMIGIPNEHQLNFNSIKCEALLGAAVEIKNLVEMQLLKELKNLYKAANKKLHCAFFPNSEIASIKPLIVLKSLYQLELLMKSFHKKIYIKIIRKAFTLSGSHHAVVWRNKAS
ncbi:hypothetical protein Tco_0018571 [Tanacetum coccineum]